MPRLLLIALLSIPCLGQAQAPPLLGYQGRLLKTDGTPETGNAQMRFGLFGTETGGSSLWEETQAISISQGYYSTYLGRLTMFPMSLFDMGTLWLEVSVQAPGDTQFRTMTPRQRVGSVAFALNARSVKGGTVDATSVSVNGTTVIDANGRLTASAGYTAGAGITIDGTTRAVSVNSSGCTSGQVLQWSGSAWQCATAGGGGISSVTGSGAITVMNGTTAPVVSVAVGTTGSTVAAGNDSRFGQASSLAGVAVSTAAPTTGQVLTFNGTVWAPASGGGISQVTGAGPVLVANGGSAPVVSVLVGVDAGTVAAGDDARFGNATSLRGVSLNGAPPASGDVLRFSGTEWSAATAVATNTAGAVVTRDSSGNFAAGTITATLVGQATNVSGVVAVANGGTGATTPAAARANLGLGSISTVNLNGNPSTVVRGDGSLGAVPAPSFPLCNNATPENSTNKPCLIPLYRCPGSGGDCVGQLSIGPTCQTGSILGNQNCTLVGRTVLF